MTRMLAVVFSEASGALAGRDVLRNLDHHGITRHAYAIVMKKPDGTIIVDEQGDSGPVGTLIGTSLGSLIGLLGGLPGVAIGAVVGSMAGAAADQDNASFDTEFVDEVSRALAPGKFALVAEIDENATNGVDLHMEELGGVTYRRALSGARVAANSEIVTAASADRPTNLQGQHKCAYSECECVVACNKQYCSDYCSDADDAKETELQCDCKHASCALA
jgi:uncharacterized membrane protein